MSMRCPLCSNRRSRVVETVSNPQESSVRRMRECPACGHRWATYEAPSEMCSDRWATYEAPSETCSGCDEHIIRKPR